MKIKVRSKDGTSSHIDVGARDSVLSVQQRLVRSLGDSPAHVEAVQIWLTDSVAVAPPPVVAAPVPMDAAPEDPAAMRLPLRSAEPAADEQWTALVKRSSAATQVIIQSVSV